METAERYRKRAEEARLLAEGMSGDLRIRMLALAQQWETLARQAEDIARVRQTLVAL